MQIELKRIQREVGITFVFVTHDQEEALTMSDRIAVMSEGWVEQIGRPEEIYHRPATVFVAGFIGQANLWHTAIEAAAGDSADVLLGDRRVTAPVAGQSVRAGDAVTFMVRPEWVRVSVDEPANGHQSVRCTVVDYVFQGPVVRFALVADGTEVVAHVGADEQLPLLRPGDAVWASWERDAALLLPESGHGAPSGDVDEP